MLQTLPWHVLTTRPGQSVEVARALKRFDAFTPRYRVRVQRAYRPDVETRPLFSCYSFARWAAEDAAAWHAIHATVGVTGIIGGEHPTPVRAGEVERLIERADADWVIAEPVDPWESLLRLGIGITVEIVDGIWQGQRGVVRRHDARKNLLGVEIPLLCRPCIVYLASDLCIEAEPEQRAPAISNSSPDFSGSSRNGAERPSRTRRGRRSGRGRRRIG
jgi:transcription antitermination factor NusG